MSASLDLSNIGNVIAAIGGLGTAAFALVDTSKVGRNGGVSNSGFKFIEAAVAQFFPGAKRISTRASKDTPKSDTDKLLDILHGHWINGAPLADQKAIAKSLIKLRLTPETAAWFAKATLVDPSVLKDAGTSMTTGKPLLPEQNNALGRFDLMLTAILDEGYQRADQKYRNSARAIASVVAVGLAVLAGWSVTGSDLADYVKSSDLWTAVLCGLLATPLAPISKDLTSALAAAVNVAKKIKK